MMQARFIRSLAEINVAQWSELDVGDSPFLSYEFFNALEVHGCVGEKLGWLPHHLVVESKNQLVAFMPLYLKSDSYGELVFDWSWADAYQRAGMPYYPKLVSAIPYTPVSGSRIFVNKRCDRQDIVALVLATIKDFIATHEVSTFHCLFPAEQDMQAFSAGGFMRRLGCQFHWTNEAYESFEHYLSFFASRKRKNIKKERASALAQGFHFSMLSGDQIEPDMWPVIFAFYEITFHKKGGLPTFTLGFFKAMGEILAKQFLVNLVSYQGKYVACAIFYRDSTHLYGRHWGCFDEYHNLHFETCYYQGLDYAIENGLTQFEPGAQGEHKISRGFLPTPTWSSHWVKDARFNQIIGEFVQKEEDHMRDYIVELQTTSPFKV